jgi:hypothetical protein
MAVNYGRKKIRVQGESLSAYGCSAAELVADIRRIRKGYMRDFNSETEFEYGSPCYDDSQYLCAYFFRDETDQEMQTRIADEERMESFAKERDAREFARLKKLFEGKT